MTIAVTAASILKGVTLTAEEQQLNFTAHTTLPNGMAIAEIYEIDEGEHSIIVERNGAIRVCMDARTDNPLHIIEAATVSQARSALCAAIAFNR